MRPWYKTKLYRMYQNSTAKLQERTPHMERRKKVYDNMGPEMHNYRVIRACNFHNQHVWADTNPSATIQSSHQQRFAINIWAGIIGECLFGPYVLPDKLNGQNYTDFLRTTLPDYLEDMPLAFRRQLYFMDDCAPAHFSLSARRHLNGHYPGRWRGRGEPIAWPPRSPDLNPLDFYLWGHLKICRVFDCCCWCTNSPCAHCSSLLDSTHYTGHFVGLH
jgi:hypothetical protein